MSFKLTESAGPCGATISGLDLSRPLSESVIRQLRSAWLKYKVIAFPEQSLTNENLEKFHALFR